VPLERNRSVVMTDAGQREAPPRGLARALSILQLAGSYERGWLRDDVIAGVAVTALVVPKALGYAEIAEVPV
jgi:hypothetical protein